MKKAMKVGLTGLTSILYILLLVPAGSAAQEDAQAQRTMTLQEVKDRLKENKNYLKEAKKKGKAGDVAGVQTALENYNRNMAGINRAMNRGGFEGSESQREEAFDRVEKATRKHGEVLANLQGKVPEQALPAIQRAMESSQKGRTTALSNLQQVRTERQQRERAEMQRQQQMGGVYGRDHGIGRQDGMPDAPSGPAGGIGRPSTPGGTSAGRGRR